ncbi:hypothetical protein ACRPH4_23250 (plasmid) [Pantoea allii]|uniref:hypothetical protein n=1 Tax=Pantoea allii TaxID=574096 RepID=UPI003D79430A
MTFTMWNDGIFWGSGVEPQFGEIGQGAWEYALNDLRTELDAGFYFWRDNIW